MFKLIESTSSPKQRNYVPIIISGFIVLVLAVGFIVLSNSEKEKQLAEMTATLSIKYTYAAYRILLYHTLLGFFIKDKDLYRSKRFIAYLSILNATLAIEGALLISSIFSGDSLSLAFIGFIAALCTLSINIIVNISKKATKATKNKRYLLTIFLLIIVIASFGAVII